MSGQAATTTIEGMPDEVVTHAHVRTFDMPDGAGRMALITIDNGLDHKRPTTFGPAGLASLDAAITQAAAEPGVTAIGITGKPYIFAVGADLTGIGMLRDRAQGVAIAKLGHDVMRRLGELPVPTFAFVNGAAMGGGTELALQCTYRTISAGAAAMSLPEVFLGLIPGWGGSYLLPRLIGPERALEVIISNPLQQNRQLKPKDVLRLGIADAMFEPADFLAQSIRWAAGVVNGTMTVTRTDYTVEEWAPLVEGARAMVDARLHGATPAPYRALDLIAAARTSDRDEGFAAEDEALADLIMTDELRASLYSFDLVQRRAKRPAGAPDAGLARTVTKVGVVGAGLMASQLALLFLRKLQVPVVMSDLDAERAAKGVAWVHREIDQLVAKNRLSDRKAARLRGLISGTTDPSAFADADMVIEAVFEELEVKRQVFAGLEAVVREDCVLATNTSSLSVTAMASGLAHPERVVGFHFFNPVAVMPLLEIARAEATDDATLATAFSVGKTLGKTCVLVADRPAFVVNRLLTRFLGDISAAVDAGTPIEVADRAMEPLGLPMSPFTLLQLVGPAVALHVSETMHAAFPDRYRVSENQRRIVEAGKTGVYTWDETGRPIIDPEVAALLVQGDTVLTEDQLRERVLDGLADEVRRMLDEGVVQAVQDIDLCMLTGAGWPFWLGGITPYLDRSGASERATGARFLPQGVASAPR